MSRRLDIGIASYRAPESLQRTITSIQQHSVCDITIHVIHNPSDGDDRTREIICQAVAGDSRIVPHWLPVNIGYAGAVNALCQIAGTEYIAYCDNDIQVQTYGWDEALCAKLDAFHEVGLIYPNGGAYPIERGPYTEVLWSPGFCWIMTRLCMSDLAHDGKTALGEVFDTTLGHQEEADVAQRIRMAGYRCASLSSVTVQHDASATNDPASVERISRGVVAWVDKWNRYFNGRNFHYHSPNVTRFEDWPPQALYLEEFWRAHLPVSFNVDAETVEIAGHRRDIIKVLRWPDMYRNRII
jgi:glycosyltransferase involved in cell wall biosynthesis